MDVCYGFVKGVTQTKPNKEKKIVECNYVEVDMQMENGIYKKKLSGSGFSKQKTYWLCNLINMSG